MSRKLSAVSVPLLILVLLVATTLYLGSMGLLSWMVAKQLKLSVEKLALYKNQIEKLTSKNEEKRKELLQMENSLLDARNKLLDMKNELADVKNQISESEQKLRELKTRRVKSWDQVLLIEQRLAKRKSELRETEVKLRETEARLSKAKRRWDRMNIFQKIPGWF